MSRDVSITASDDKTQRLTNGADPNLAHDAGGTADDVQIPPLWRSKG